MMKDLQHMPKRSRVNRRAFLRGAGGAIAIGLPFLEGLPERSAWAQGDDPKFALFMCSANGIVQRDFWPSSGALTAASFDGKSTSPLAEFASNLLFVKGINFPGRLSGCGHAEGLCQSLTGSSPSGSGNGAQGGSISADMAISDALNPSGVDPLTLYSGAKNYIGERLSFGSGGGRARSAQLNPYAAFKDLVSVVESAPAEPVSMAEPAAPAEPAMVDELLVRRRSVNDTVLSELQSILAKSALSSADRVRIVQHIDAVRELETNFVATGNSMMGVTGAACSMDGMDESGIDAFRDRISFSQNGNMIEDIVKLHGEVVALSFACNQNRVATVQWGDGTDGTKYSGIGGPGWPFHQVSHRVASDSATGNDASAEAAHVEIDAIRMTTLAHIVQQFENRGLLDKALIYWTSHVAEGNHSFSNVPALIAGSPGGFLKQGEMIDSRGDTGELLASLISATGVATDRFGSGGGQLSDIHA